MRRRSLDSDTFRGRLRDYQVSCGCEVVVAFKEHDRVLTVLPTGTGKTVIFAHVAEHWAEYQEGRVLVIEPMLQLIEQTARKIRQVTRERVDIEQGSRRADVTFNPATYVVASKATLDSRERYKRFTDIGLVIVDEAHLAATSRYKAILDYFIGMGAKVLGVTATPKRGDKRALRQLFDCVAYQMGVGEAIDGGWLCPCKTHCVTVEELDLSAVGTLGEDFKIGELSKVMEEDKVCYEIAAVTAREANTPRPLKTVVFCATVDQARKTAAILSRAHGVEADWVCGDSSLRPMYERERILKYFEERSLQVVCNVGVLTTGWDFPGLEHIVLARPTKSLSLFTQIFGRGTRPLPGLVDHEGMTADQRRAAIRASAKPHFKFTDLRDNSLVHRLITPTDVLGGELGLDEHELQHAADVLADAAEAIDVGEAIEQARERRRRQLEQEAAELARRKAEARYHSREVDVLSNNRLHDAAEQPKRKKGARMLFGKHRGKLISDLPDPYLAWAVGQLDKAAALRAEGMTDYQVRKEGVVAFKEPLATWLTAEHARRNGEPHSPRAASVDEINAMLMER